MNPTKVITKGACWTWNRDANGCSATCPDGRLHQCEHCGEAHRGMHGKKNSGKGGGKGGKDKKKKPSGKKGGKPWTA